MIDTAWALVQDEKRYPDLEELTVALRGASPQRLIIPPDGPGPSCDRVLLNVTAVRWARHRWRTFCDAYKGAQNQSQGPGHLMKLPYPGRLGRWRWMRMIVHTETEWRPG